MELVEAKGLGQGYDKRVGMTKQGKTVSTIVRCLGFVESILTSEISCRSVANVM